MTQNEPAPDASQSLTIPLEAHVLGEFISGLLGQSRLLERRFIDRRFEVDLSWLLNLDQIIAQRLSSQNQAKLVSFTARFYFANGKTITLEDHNAFVSFYDLSNELSTGVDLRWSYLIKFPLAKLPEKQEIRFLAFTDKDIEKQKPHERKETKSFVSTGSRDGSLSIAIHFTDVTWGEDIYGHMVNYIVAKTESLPKITTWARKLRSTTILPISGLAGMIALLWAFYSSITSGISRVLKKYGDFEQLKFQTVDEKIDFLVSLAIARRDLDFFPFAAIGRAFLAISVVSATLFLATVTKASFININDYSAQYLKRYGRNFDFIKYGVIAALAVGILSGVFANKVYDLIKTWL